MGGEKTLGRSTVNAYLDALESIFVVENQPAWSVGLRSRATLRRAPKGHFVDPSLAAAMLRASPETVAGDPAMFGPLFESLVVRDRRNRSTRRLSLDPPMEVGGLGVDRRGKCL